MVRKAVSHPAPEDVRPGSSQMEWELGVPLATHPLMLASVAKAFGMVAILMSLLLSFLMAVSGGADTIPMVVAMSFGISAAIMVVGLLASALIFGNRLTMRFSLDAKGARAEVIDRRATAVSIANIVLGTLAGKPGAVGTGLITLADSDRQASWRGLVTFAYYPRFRAIRLANSWRTVMILFCTPENYAEVEAFVRAAAAKRPTRASAKVNPIPKLLLHTGLIVLATVPFFVFDHPVKLDMFVPLLVLCFALAMLWLIPLFAYVVWAGLGYLWVVIGLQLMAERTSQFRSLGRYRAFEVLNGDDIALIVAALAGTAYLVWLGRGLMTGRVRTALGGDMDELDRA